MKNMWKSGIMGVIVGDALGCPVQFETRTEVAKHPVKGMIGFRTFNMPEGTWTDDSALTLALLESISRMGTIRLHDVANNFVKWLIDGKFTPYGFAFDIGRGTMYAIQNYERNRDYTTCGGREAGDNGNGSIMRIMPAVLYCIEKGYDDKHATDIIHAVSALTHAHARAEIACGLYYFMARAIVNGTGKLIDLLQTGMKDGIAFYRQDSRFGTELTHYTRLFDLSAFKRLSDGAIKTSGYVVDTLEAAVWGLITTNSFDKALLKIVNLGGDTDSIAAVAGGLAGLFYGYDAIPTEWLDVIQRREWIEKLIETMV